MSRKIEIIENINNDDCDNFLKLEKKLKNLDIKSILDAENLSKKAEEFGDIDAADIERVWTILWDKRLYSGMKEATATKWKKQLEDVNIHENHMMREISIDPKIVLDLKKNSDITVPDDRLIGIHSAAKYLINREEKFGKIIFPYLKKECSKKVLMANTIESMQQGLGKGWGHTTVFHFLTDIGISVKPDIHVARTLNFMGISKFIDDVKDSYRPNLEECIDIHFVILGMSKILREVSSHYTMRYIDKILMNISKDGALEN